MATTLTISTSGLTTTLSTEDDVAAVETLLRFAEAIGIPDEATPQAKLDAVAAHLAQYMVAAARERWFQAESAALRVQAEDEVHW